jgi:ethanolamine transporter EutH
MSDIKLVPTKEILNELQSRFETYVFMGVQTNVFRKGDIVYNRAWSGEETGCAGLCMNLAHYISMEQMIKQNPMPRGEGA